ncbi:MAG: uncharacterized protein KVP18_001788 [Porospora cf. gigantea A]|nr:MAG: hypothetical protein KVP18_001788 [Porospora cf. gigantea A]
MSMVLAKRLGCSVDCLPSPHSKLTQLPSRARLVFEVEDEVLCVDAASDCEPPNNSWPLVRLYNTFALPGVPMFFKQQMGVALKAIRALKNQLPSIAPAFFRRVLVHADETVVVNVCGVDAMLGRMQRLSLGVYPVSRPGASDSGVGLDCALLLRGPEADVTSGITAIIRALDEAQICFTVDDKEVLPDEKN